jgi:hypothetical protein
MFPCQVECKGGKITQSLPSDWESLLGAKKMVAS